MATGEFLRAWQMNDCTGNHWPSAHRLWAGGATQPATLSVNSLHGLGDAVQMLRYAPRLKLLAPRVCYHVPAELRTILPYFKGVECLPPQEAMSRPASSHSAAIEMMELPYLFRTRAEELPLAVNYLELPPHLLHESFALMGSTSKPRIGVVWAGGDWDRERWVPLTQLSAIFKDDRFEWWNLQGGRNAQEADDLPLKSQLQLCGDGVMQLTASIANLDLVITVDSLAAHLAGALGKPAWLMLKHDADWRWMQSRSDSPWYPSLRLFRQASPGDWHGVRVALEQALRELSQSKDLLCTSGLCHEGIRPE